MKHLGYTILSAIYIATVVAIAIIVAGSTGAAFVAFGPLIGVVVALFWIAIGVALDKSERL